MIRRGWQLDGQYNAATIHEQRTPLRVNAADLLQLHPEMCDEPDSQTLVNMVLYGSSASNYSAADLDRHFGAARRKLNPGTPS